MKTNEQLIADVSVICSCIESAKELIVRFKEMEAQLAKSALHHCTPTVQSQSEIEALAHRRCKRYIHIDTEAPYQFDGQALMDFVRDVQRNTV